MNATTILERRSGRCLEKIAELPQWYAVSTLARHEKQVARQLRHDYFEYLLPLYKSVRRWKDRRVILDIPLFPGYLFVHISLQERLSILRLPSVSRFVEFNGFPIAIPAQEIETVRRSLVEGVRAEPYPYLAAGSRVRIANGPLTGLCGILLVRKGTSRLVISIQLLRRSVAIEVSADTKVILETASAKSFRDLKSDQQEDDWA